MCHLRRQSETFRRDQSLRLPAATPPRVESRHGPDPTAESKAHDSHVRGVGAAWNRYGDRPLRELARHGFLDSDDLLGRQDHPYPCGIAECLTTARNPAWRFGRPHEHSSLGSGPDCRRVLYLARSASCKWAGNLGTENRYCLVALSIRCGGGGSIGDAHLELWPEQVVSLRVDARSNPTYVAIPDIPTRSNCSPSRSDATPDTIAGMTEERKKSGWPWIVGLLIVLPVLYVASFGPACWLGQRDVVSVVFVNAVYGPIVWSMRQGPTPVRRFLRSYSGSFGSSWFVIDLMLFASND